VASGEMAVAYFRAHAPHGFWPIRNRGELAVLFCFVFLYIASRGDSGWNLRHLMRGKRI
jgi:putative oxidoreductase